MQSVYDYVWLPSTPSRKKRLSIGSKKTLEQRCCCVDPAVVSTQQLMLCSCRTTISAMCSCWMRACLSCEGCTWREMDLAVCFLPISLLASCLSWSISTCLKIKWAVHFQKCQRKSPGLNLACWCCKWFVDKSCLAKTLKHAFAYSSNHPSGEHHKLYEAGRGGWAFNAAPSLEHLSFCLLLLVLASSSLVGVGMLYPKLRNPLLCFSACTYEQISTGSPLKLASARSANVQAYVTIPHCLPVARSSQV